MKIHITENLDKSISGYSLIPIIYGSVDLQSVPQNGASSIIAIDAVDSIKYENIIEFINAIILKMRLNSTLYIGGIDAYYLSKNLISGQISLEEYNSYIYGKQGIYDSKFIIDLLQKHNVKILSIIFKDNRYEITATRSVN